MGFEPDILALWATFTMPDQLHVTHSYVNTILTVTISVQTAMLTILISPQTKHTYSYVDIYRRK